MSPGLFPLIPLGGMSMHSSIAPDRTEAIAEAYRRIYVDGLRNAFAGFEPRQVLFTGSTSVYAQTDGSWVDESSETRPNRETGRILLEAEAMALNPGDSWRDFQVFTGLDVLS